MTRQLAKPGVGGLPQPSMRLEEVNTQRNANHVETNIGGFPEGSKKGVWISEKKQKGIDGKKGREIRYPERRAKRERASGQFSNVITM